MNQRRLLRFARELQGATDFDLLVRMVKKEVLDATSYKYVWLYVVEEDRKFARVLAVEGTAAQAHWERAPRIAVEGDEMIAEILRGEGPVVVVDGRTDPRTNKDIIAALNSRTIVNVPLAWLDQPLGAMGTGTFGEEGVRPPTEDELDTLVLIASQVSVAVARIRWVQERERLSREQAAVQRRMLVAQKMETVGTLAGGIAHDLNNLLTVVNINLQVAQGHPLDPEQTEALQGIALASERAAALTRKLLAMARPQPEKVTLVDLHERIQELATLLHTAFPSSISVSQSLHATRFTCIGDRSQLDQVLTNLCVNAKDAMPNGGRLLIETQNVDVGDEYVRAHPWAIKGRYLLISVSDTGEGMNSELLERIFEPFFTTKSATKGTGLGLAVVHGVVRQHRGMVHAYSEPGLGTTMKVFLPFYEGSALPVPLEAREPVALGTERVLVAEDDAEIRALIARVLEDAGYIVTAVADGAEAVAAAGREPFDLVLLDVVMPRLSGPTALERISSLRPGTRFLMSTGYAQDLLASPAVVGVEILSKPFDPPQLLLAVRRALEAPVRAS